MFGLHILSRCYILSRLRVFIFSLFLLPSGANAGAYDAMFVKWGGVYTPEIPWYWLKAQAIAESNLNTRAVSPVGAMGVGQFMPETWRDMERELGFRGSAFNASLNIQAQAYYMSKLRGQFKAPRPEWDKHSLALASYNAGLGNVLKAQSYENTLYYIPMQRNLHRVTGHHSLETTNYVRRIWVLTEELEREYGKFE